MKTGNLSKQCNDDFNFWWLSLLRKFDILVKNAWNLQKGKNENSFNLSPEQGIVDMKNGWSSVLTIICAAEHKEPDFQIADTITFMIYSAPLAGQFQVYFRNEKSLEFLLTDSPAFGSQNYLKQASLIDLWL